MDYNRVIRRLQQDPRNSLESARRGSISDLTELANLWQEVPNLLTLGILDVFYVHLDIGKAPTAHDPVANASAAANRAFMSLLGLSKAGNFIGDDKEYSRAIIKAWPGIFKWSSFFFAVRVTPPTQRPDTRRSSMDVLSGVLYSISKDDDVRKTIVDTPGSVELATRLWLFQDAVPIPSSVDIPVGTAALDSILRVADRPTLDRVLKTAGGKPDQVAQLALTRLRTEGHKIQIEGFRTAVYTDILCQFSRPARHPLRHAILIAGGIPTVTKILVTVSSQINSTGNPMLLDAVVALFGYLRNCLESTDGFTWVSQSVQAGLLTAFVGCSPHVSNLDREDREMILSIFKDVLPRYLVYRSVIRTISTALRTIFKTVSVGQVSNSVAKDVWKRFTDLAEERMMVEAQAAAWKGKATICDNANCLKVDSKNNFRKCSACGSTHYCSKECQTAAWKEGDHKTMCKLKQRERLEGKKQTTSKGDKVFFHHLSIRDACRHLSHLRSIAAREYPDTPVWGLVICIDYRTIPEKYSVRSIVGYDGPETFGTVNEKARNDALFEKVRDNQDKYTLLESKVANGLDDQLVLTLCSSFWGNKDIRLLDEDGVDHDGSSDEGGDLSPKYDLD